MASPDHHDAGVMPIILALFAIALGIIVFMVAKIAL